MPDVVLRSVDQTVLHLAPRPEAAATPVSLHPRKCGATNCHDAPSRAMVPSEDFAHIAAEHLGELDDLILGRLGTSDLIVETGQNGLDVLDTAITPIEMQTKVVSCEVHRVEGICLRDLLNLVINHEACFSHTAPSVSYSARRCARQRGNDENVV